MIDFSEKTTFGYAVSRVRALETRLIDRPTMLRLFEESLPGVCGFSKKKAILQQEIIVALYRKAVMRPLYLLPLLT